MEAPVDIAPAALCQSRLREYLSEQFKPQNHAQLLEGGWTDEKLISHFLELGVVVKAEENLYIFKYDQLLCLNWPEHIRECRGILLARFKSYWNVLSRPFDKFFNQHEKGCPVQDEKEFNKICSEMQIVEKADGTCLQFWMDRRSKLDKLVEAESSENFCGRRCSTLGTITPDPLFFELASKVVNIDQIYAEMDFRVTYLFELCCAENRIVTIYPSNRMFLLSARDLYSGVVFDSDRVDAIAKKMKNVLRPAYIACKDIPLLSLKDVKEFVETESLRTDRYGHHPEGFVMYYRGAPLCKLKNKKYLEKHGLCTGDFLYQRNIAIALFFAESIDDVWDCLHPPIQRYVDELREKVRHLMIEVKQIRNDHFKDAASLSKRDYIARCKEHVPPKFTAFFQTSYDEICHGTTSKKNAATYASPELSISSSMSMTTVSNPDGTTKTSATSMVIVTTSTHQPEIDVGGLFCQWLKKPVNYNKYGAFWKASKVPELVERELAQNGKTFSQMAALQDG